MEVDLDGLFRQNTTYDYDSDYEYKEETDTEGGGLVWVPVVYTLVLLVGLLGNVVLLAVLAQRRQVWKISDIFILHLSNADILLLVTLPFRAALAAGSGWCSGTLCKICGAVFNLNFFCGIFLLVCISLDHYLSTAHAVRLYSRRKPWIAHISCLLVWLGSLLLTIPDWIFLVAERDQTEVIMLCFHSHSETSLMVSRLFHHTVGFALPAAVLIFCCASILLRLQCSLKALQKQRAALLILPLVGVFFLCWVPYNFALIVDTLMYSSKEPRDKSLKTALEATSALGCIHACLRPLLYIGLCGNFRNQSMALLKCATVESKGSLWQLGLDEEALPEQHQADDELKQMTSTDVEHQLEKC